MSASKVHLTFVPCATCLMESPQSLFHTVLVSFHEIAMKMVLTYIQGVLKRWNVFIESQLNASQDSGKGIMIDGNNSDNCSHQI